MLGTRFRESVILDAADEAIYKASRRASRNLTPLFDPPTPISSRMSAESDRDSTSAMAEAMYESFRWMDEEEDINLKLVLDDYHANLDGFVVPSSNSHRRPSFRRTMSITKMPFGRNSLSSIQSRSATFEPNASHIRQKSRTLSLIAPKHVPHDSISSIDPNATHYQDPAARLKLRVYLGSPQKFDEAIEFGFPSLDGVADGTDKENKAPNRTSKDAIARMSHATDTTHSSFFYEDTASLFDDESSMVEAESPLTPIGIDIGLRPRGVSPTYLKSRTSLDILQSAPKPTLVKQPESYAQAMAGSREMTLRMTLTRPDLRADEKAIYGWQATTTKTPSREEPGVVEDMEQKYEARGPFGGVDGWEPEKENGVVKRFWNRVKSQKKAP